MNITQTENTQNNKQDIITVKDPAELLRLEKIKSDLENADGNSILFFGSKAQEDITVISEQMLEGVKNKELGAAGDSLASMVNIVSNFDIDQLNPNRKQGFFAKLFGKNKPLDNFVDDYNDVKSQIDRISDQLEVDKTQLLTDIISLDRLYDANLKFFKNLELHIAAGDQKRDELENQLLPQLNQQVEESPGDVVLSQTLRDKQHLHEDLMHRLYDLRLTRQVAMQSLPSIRLIQENNKTLINKINSTLINTIPLWKNQMAQAIAIFRMGKVADTVKTTSNLNNELLESNADNLRTANEKVQQLKEKGIFDIESVREANQTLIDTINDSLQIAADGKNARNQAMTEIQSMEDQLREALVTAKNHAPTEG